MVAGKTLKREAPSCSMHTLAPRYCMVQMDSLSFTEPDEVRTFFALFGLEKLKSVHTYARTHTHARTYLPN